MSYLVLNPEFQRLETELCAIDRQRDHLRAQMADAAMRAELEETSKRTSTFWLSPEIRQARVEALAEKIRKREARRAAEMARYGSYTRPGTWDKDLDDYQEPRYEEETSDGYKIRLVRDYGLTWRGYVVLPEGHPVIGKHYEFFGMEAPAGMPRPPQHLTYGGPAAERGVYGFYLTNTVTPRDDETRYDSYNFYSVETTGFSVVAPNGSVYVDYAHIRRMCLELVDYFKGLAADPSVLSPPPAAAEPEPEPEAEPIQYFTSMRAPPARRTVTPPQRSLASMSCLPPPKPKKSWAAVAGGK